jgi:hypothetical protein
MNDDKLKEMAAHEEITTKDVVGPLAISPELLKKKRPYNRKVKTVVEQPILVEEREWYCATCRETIPDSQVMKMGAGDNGRAAIFCCYCQKSLGFLQPDVDTIVDNLIKNNPTK